MLKKGNQTLIAVMEDAAKTFAEEVDATYYSFEKKRAESEKFCKDFKEGEKIHAKQMKEIKAKHRALVRASEDTVQAALADGALKLADELADALCKPIPQGFSRMFEAYASSNMKPGKAELEALVCLAENHPSALRMIDNLCERTGADYFLEHPGISELEADVSYLAKLGSLFDIPLTKPEQVASSVALFAGQDAKGFSVEPVPDKAVAVTGEIIPGVGDYLVPNPSVPGARMRYLRDDGRIEEGDAWSIPYLNAAQITFQEIVTRLSEMKKRWSGGIYAVKPTESDEGIQIAKKMGRQVAATESPVDERLGDLVK